MNYFKTIDGIGILEMGHFALFWTCFLLMSVRAGLGCNTLDVGIVLAVVHILLVFFGIVYIKSQNINKIISKREAVIILTEKRQNIPSLDWRINCEYIEETYGKSFSC